jgi:hypothetical protein
LQDGTVESGIASPELFPIHHLDELEFFPGDFVIDAKGKVDLIKIFLHCSWAHETLHK